MVRRHQQYIVRLQQRPQFRQAAVVILQPFPVTQGVPAMAEGRIEIHKIGKHQRPVRRILHRLQGSVKNLVQPRRGIMLRNAPVGENIGDLPHRIHVAPRRHQFIQQRVLVGRHRVIVTVGRYPLKILRLGAHKRTGDDPGNLIGLHQFKTQLAEIIQPFQAEALLVAGDLQHAVRRRIDDGLAGAHMLLAQLFDDLRTAGQLFPQHPGQVSFLYNSIHQLLRETVGLVGKIAPFKIHRHTGDLPVAAEGVLPLAHLRRAGIGRLHPAGIQGQVFQRLIGNGMGHVFPGAEPVGRFQPHDRQVRQRQIPGRAVRVLPVFRHPLHNMS